MNSNYEDSLLHLNVGGRQFSITKRTALEIHGSLFAQLASYDHQDGPFEAKNIHYRPDLNEFLIERSPILFDLIIHYVYSGHVNRPVHICAVALEEEFKFWGLEMCNAGLLCCQNGKEAVPSERSIESRKVSKIAVVLNGNSHTGPGMGRRLDKLWEFCEDPESSKGALIFNVMCILSIVISIANLVISTIPRLQHCEDMSFLHSGFSNTAYSIFGFLPGNETETENATSNLIPHLKLKRINERFSHACDGGYIFDMIELVCIIWFTIELLLRFISCPDKVSFVKSPMNIIDFFATFPFYIELAIWAGGLIADLNRVSSVSSVLLMLRVMRVLRAFRVLRLARYFDSLQMMGETLWESRRDMGLLVLFLAVGVLIFSTILFYVEKDVEGTAYTSIPAAFWFAIVTLTTTGYGDITPQTTVGKMVAGVACIAGVLILAFPVSILVEHFRMSYAGRRRNRLSSSARGASTVATVTDGMTTKVTIRRSVDRNAKEDVSEAEHLL